MTMRWRKSSRSNGAGGECVEVAVTTDGVGVRDSKNAAGPVLVVGPSGWDALRRTVTRA
jgi:hypothetical protein